MTGSTVNPFLSVDGGVELKLPLRYGVVPQATVPTLQELSKSAISLACKRHVLTLNIEGS